VLLEKNSKKYLVGGCKEDRARLFSAVLNGKARGNVQRLKHVKFRLNTGQHFLTVVAVEHWHRLTREILEPLS